MLAVPMAGLEPENILVEVTNEGRLILHGEQRAREKAFALGVVTVETNQHGTSQYCSRCGARGERFSYLGGKYVTVKWGKLFRCPVCHYEAQADHNASSNLHHTFYQEYHWQPRLKRSG